MKKALLIAEKPSLMRAIKDIYDSHKNELDVSIDFTAQHGHLVRLLLPSEVDEHYKKWVPENFPIDVPYIYKPIEGSESTIKDINDKIHSGKYDFIIHAGDADGEGELLVNLVLNYCKNTLPVYRFWNNSLTEKDILHSLKNLKPDSNYAGFYDAALTRQHLDYQFGMNITGLFSVLARAGVPFKLGRVKAIIIALIVQRELDIRNFKPHSTFKRAFSVNQNGVDYFFIAEDDEFTDNKKAFELLPKTDKALIVKSIAKTVKKSAPKLYKLSTLQSDAYKTLKFPGAKTLQILQSLYEKKMVSYPRTDCEYISSSMDIEGIKKSLLSLYKNAGKELVKTESEVKANKTYCNDKEVAKESHTGIIPTGSLSALSSLSQEEKALFNLICRRFLAIWGKEKVVINYTGEGIPANEKDTYTCKLTSEIEAGYELILNPEYKCKTVNIPSFKEQENVSPIKFQIKEVIAKPPVRYNDGSIITAMGHPEPYILDGKKIEYKIGTPATRAGIIEECIANGYFTREKGVFIPTRKAEYVYEEIGSLPLFDVKTSGSWEGSFEKIRNNEIDAKSVEDKIYNECLFILEEIRKRNIHTAEFAKKVAGNSDNQTLGKCPKCGSDVIYGKFGAYCSGKCGLYLSKVYGTMLNKTQAKALISNKPFTITIKGKKATLKSSGEFTEYTPGSFSIKVIPA